MIAVLAQAPNVPAGKLCQLIARPIERVIVIVLGGIKPAASQTDCARFILTPMKSGTMHWAIGLGVAVGSDVGVGVAVGVGVGVGVGEAPVTCTHAENSDVLLPESVAVVVIN